MFAPKDDTAIAPTETASGDVQIKVEIQSIHFTHASMVNGNTPPYLPAKDEGAIDWTGTANADVKTKVEILLDPNAIVCIGSFGSLTRTQYHEKVRSESKHWALSNDGYLLDHHYDELDADEVKAPEEMINPNGRDAFRLDQSAGLTSMTDKGMS